MEQSRCPEVHLYNPYKALKPLIPKCEAQRKPEKASTRILQDAAESKEETSGFKRVGKACEHYPSLGFEPYALEG